MNAINNLSFSVHNKKPNKYLFQWMASIGLYCFLAEYHTLRIPQQKETVIGMFVLYKVLLIRVGF